jgi:hypothetical protein
LSTVLAGNAAVPKHGRYVSDDARVCVSMSVWGQQREGQTWIPTFFTGAKGSRLIPGVCLRRPVHCKAMTIAEPIACIQIVDRGS